VFSHADDPDASLQIPGGGVEPGESLEEAVLREAPEVSGLRCEIVDSSRVGATRWRAPMWRGAPQRDRST
jgi:ADP-ribose pyrophosphatase YjhB (NUDIX family)